jgi:DNA primase
MKDGTDLRAEVARLKAAASLAAVIGETLPLNRAGRFMVALCPFHGEKTPSFYVFADHFHCFGCGAHGDAIAWLMGARGMTFLEAVAHLGGTGDRLHTQAAAPTPARTLGRARTDDADAQRHRELARRIWCECSPADGSPVEAYLRHRGVRLPDAPVLRWHPRCPRTGGALPAMVALMTDARTGQPTGIHRTFLLADGTGKAPVDKPKMMLGPAGVIRLAEPTGEGLGLAEGIETALATMQRIGWQPVWAAGSRGGIETFPVLPACTLTIFADGDAPGLQAARDCAGRWTAADREALIYAAPAGEDWADATTRKPAA